MAATQPSERRAALWDMDGTIVDSAEQHWLSWQIALADEGRAMTHNQFLATFGQRNDAILRRLYGAGLPDSDVARIANAKEQSYRDLVRQHGVASLPGVRDWLARLQAAGWQQAVASSAPRANLDILLAALDLAHYFAAIISAEDVRQGKPDPELYLTAAAAVGAPPARCIVVEDARAGVEGAHRAGMRAIGVGPQRATLGADLAIASLADLPADAFDRLLGDRG
ncbi:MAG: HAD family hydrolase [Thermomicrobiales bacterium]